jgi:hypothetical protein
VIPESGRGKRVMNLLNPNSLRVHFLERSHRRRRISYCHENAQGEILRFAQNDSREAFFRNLLSAALVGSRHPRSGAEVSGVNCLWILSP